MDCAYICQKIHQAIIRYQQDSPDISDALLIIDIRTPTTNDDSLIPKLEHKTE